MSFQNKKNIIDKIRNLDIHNSNDSVLNNINLDNNFNVCLSENEVRADKSLSDDHDLLNDLKDTWVFSHYSSQY